METNNDKLEAAMFRWLMRGLPYNVVVPTENNKNVTYLVAPRPEASWANSFYETIKAELEKEQGTI